jgi:hypothetical protein
MTTLVKGNELPLTNALAKLSLPDCPMTKKTASTKQVADFTHSEATRRNISNVEHQSVMQRCVQAAVKVCSEFDRMIAATGAGA